MLNKNFKKNIPLKKHTTFRIGGLAKFFYSANNKKDLIKAIEAAKELDIPVFVLGGGSNLLVSDKGFDGLVIKMDFNDFKIQGTKVVSETGVKLGELVNATVREGLTGLEFAAGIYGTVGGAVIGNAGAYGGCMEDVVESVEVLAGDQVIPYTKEQLRFGYRESIFKLSNNNDILLSVYFVLQKGNKEKSKEIVKDILNKRKKALPFEYASAGCIFKNIESDENIFKKINKNVRSDIEARITHGKIPAAFLVDYAGCKGMQAGDAQVSEKHANFIVNKGNASASDVIALIKQVKKCVLDKTGLELELEVRLLGF